VLDEELLDRLERGAFGYFLEQSHPLSGLVADKSRPGSPARIAVVGFALSAYVVGVERGWLERDAALTRTLTSLRFFERSEQSSGPSATGYGGFYYHFLDLESGKRVWHSEVSPIDSALLVAGMLTAASYFDGAGADETELRALVRELYARMDFGWVRDGQLTVAQGWTPEAGFFNYHWQGYNEAALLYVLGLAAPQRPLPHESYAAWTATYQWENIYGRDLLYAGPLFVHQFSHAWIDFRNIRDAYMREKGSDYFENSRRAVDVQRHYARLDPNEHGLAADSWGLTAGDGPGFEVLEKEGRQRRFFEYTARGVPFGPDDGTVAPAGVLAALPFAPAQSLAAVRRWLKLYPEWCESWRLPSGINPGAPDGDARGWVSQGYFGLDQGLVVLMLENYRSEMLWRLMRKCQPMVTGLRRAGFTGGWL
jgi:hypothetical protein